MKKPLLISAGVLALLAVSATLFAQTTTGSSLITEMKAGIRTFTLAADLNPGVTGLQSAAVSGKKTGDMLTAGEWNRMLELVAQGGGGSGAANNPLIICDKNFTFTAGGNRAGTTFTASDCGGTLPDATYMGILSKYGVPGGEYHPNVINAGETVEGYTGPGFFVWSVTTTASTGYVRIVYIKKSGLVSSGGTGSAASGKMCLFVYQSGSGSSLNSHMHTVAGTSGWTNETCRSYAMSSKGGSAIVNYYLGCVSDAGITYGTISSNNPTTANAGIPSPNCGW